MNSSPITAYVGSISLVLAERSWAKDLPAPLGGGLLSEL